MKQWQKVAVSIFVVILAALQIGVILGPYDDWPFASNSMFGFYRTPDDKAYDLIINLQDASGQSRRLAPGKDLGVPSDDAFRRLFFARWYGSVNPVYPQGKYPNDTVEQFTARLADFCQKVTAVMKDRGNAPAAITIEIREMSQVNGTWQAGSQRLIGTYRVADNQFVLNPDRDK